MTCAEAFSLSGETALITGGGSGLGAAIAKSFVASGVQGALVGRREDSLARVASELGEHAIYAVHDIAARDDDNTVSVVKDI